MVNGDLTKVDIVLDKPHLEVLNWLSMSTELTQMNNHMNGK